MDDDDSLEFEKKRAMARFNRVRAVMRLWKIVQLAIIVAAISWCSPALVRSTGFALFESFSAYACNHHVAFLVGNAIIVSVFLLFRQSAPIASAVRRENVVYDDYVKYSELACPKQGEEDATAATPSVEFDDKRIVAPVFVEDAVDIDIASKCDEVGKAIAEATRQIRRFERTHSETLRREFALKRELRRAETEARRETVSPEAAEIDNLSSEEFRRRVDAFIDEHWRRRAAAKLEGNEIVDRD